MNLHRSLLSLGIALSALAISAAPLKAATPTFIDFKNGGSLISGNSLSGNVNYEGWSNLNNTSTPNTSPAGPGTDSARAKYRPYGNHNNPAGWYNWTYDADADEGAGAWIQGAKSTISSNLGTGTSSLWKKSGSGYLSASIHQGATNYLIEEAGNFELTIAPIANLQTVVFQLQATNRTVTATNEKVVFFSLPVIKIGEVEIAATDSLLTGRIVDYSTGGFGAQDMDFYAFQWDLSGYDITAPFTIEWKGVSNSGIFGLQVDQGDTYLQVVPEPSTWALITIAGVAGLAKLRRRQKAA